MRMHATAKTWRSWLLAAIGVATMSLAIVAQSSPATLPLTGASLIIEINATDGDAGIQPFMDAAPWRRAVIYRPDGQELFRVETEGELRDYGLTELFSESSEPPFARFSLERFKELFPAGEYRFEATAVDGTRMVGTATLTHDFPPAPLITSPKPGAAVSRDDTIVAWAPADSDADVDGYHVIIEQEVPRLRTFAADVPASVRSLPVPAEFLQPGPGYKVEVMAIGSSGNRTLSEVAFAVE